MQGSTENILTVWSQSLLWERLDGAAYYDRQRRAITTLARSYSYTQQQGVAVFAALSPNNDEAGTYRAAEVCMKIGRGRLSADYPVQGYPANKAKALRILLGMPPLEVLSGPKVLAFFHNTMQPDNGEWVTVDGHMVGVWRGHRHLLRGVRGADRPDGMTGAEISKAEYAAAAEDFRTAAGEVGLSAPRFQAVLWLAWKRIHRIRYTPPQLLLPLQDWDFPYTNGGQRCRTAK
jgi:hypothetical protein